MPSTPRNTTTRKHQHQQYQQEEYRSDPSTSLGSKGSQSPPTTTFVPDSPTPHPYHAPSPPTSYTRLDQRVGSHSSQVSDMTMDDFGGATHDSVLEYSDTSDENREESYFLQHSMLGDDGGGGRHGGLNRLYHESGESAFRDLRLYGSRSSRIVKYDSSGDIDDDISFPFEDEYDVHQNHQKNHHPSSDQNYNQHQHDGHPILTDGSSKRLSHPPPPDHNHHQGNNPHMLRDWMTSLAYSFRSPSALHHHKTAAGSGGGGGGSGGVSGGGGSGKNNNHPSRHHKKQPSSSIMEYPYSSKVPFREHQRYPSSSSSSWGGGGGGGGGGGNGHGKMNSIETSPLLRMSQGSKSLAVGHYGTEYTTSLDHPLKRMNGGMDRDRMLNDDHDEILDENNNNRKNNYHHNYEHHHDHNDDHDHDNTHSKTTKQNNFKSRSTAATIAAFYLMDYEAGRPPTLSPQFEMITKSQLQIYRIHFSWVWQNLGVHVAVLMLFMAHTQNRFETAIMHTYAIFIFFVEIWMKEELYHSDPAMDPCHSDRPLVRPLILFLVVLGVESWVWYLFMPQPEVASPTMASAVFKPVVFFYVSLKARHALESLMRISVIVMRVLVIEMFLILTFAAVACQMYKEYDTFSSLSRSWLSLFELSTTVVNPSVWMPMYYTSPTNAFFFVFFIITSVFYLHSLVLSVVFQTYIQAATDIYERSSSDRENAVRLAYLALMKDETSECISASSVRKTLQVVRPHYSSLKIKALMDIVDPTNQQLIDYPTFRTKIRQALNASIRTARTATNFAMGVELIAVLVAVVNFVYVILLTSEFQADWFDAVTVSAGSAITILGLLELVIRFNPLRIPNFASITRLNPTFDGLALLGALVSCIGIVHYVAGYDTAVNYILMGRAIDMIRIMRFFQIFRDVVRRSADVLPAMAGPLVLVLSIIHVFVYVGMALWCGAIDESKFLENPNVTPLYYLNNFNSYTRGLVTMFNIMVVNDWHSIAAVFLYADRYSHPYIVYPFFISAICWGVFIMVNVITAFFVESFVTKIVDGVGDPSNDDLAGVDMKDRDFRIRTGDNTNVKRISSTRDLRELSDTNDGEPILNTTSETHSRSSSASTEIFAFDVYEREGFDQIMRTVAGATSEEQEAFAQSLCNTLEIFESMTLGREKVGYMVCCQQSMNRFGNRRFQNNAIDFVKSDLLHKIITDMHSELLALSFSRSSAGRSAAAAAAASAAASSSSAAFGGNNNNNNNNSNSNNHRCLVRSFDHKTNVSLQLEISASIIRFQPAVTLFVSRIRPASYDDP